MDVHGGIYEYLVFRGRMESDVDINENWFYVESCGPKRVGGICSWNDS